MRLSRRLVPFASVTLLASALAFGIGPVSARGDRPDPSQATPSIDGGVHVMPTVGSPQPGIASQGPSTQLNTGNGIDYHGGPIVPSMKVVSIYWSAATIYNGGPTPGTVGTGAQDGSLIGYFLRNLAGSSYYNINTTYGDTVGGGHTVLNNVSYSGYWANTHNAPSGTQNVSDTTIKNEIIFGFTSGKIAYDASTIYSVFSANNVNLGGGAYTQYCAYHGYFNWNGNIVLYSVQPYAYHSGCTLLSGSPNNDFGADATVNVLTHELEETNTDPQLNAWYDSNGYENADKCAWTFGTTYTTPNGATANIKIGTRDWLVQQQWLNANGGSCVKSWAGGGPTVPGAATLNSATAGDHRVTLTWSAPTSDGGSGITGYNVNRGTTSGGETLLIQLAGTGTSLVDAGAVNGTTYYYTVQAKNNVGTGAASNELSATPTAAPTVPGIPTLNSATAGDHSVALAWSAPASDGGSPITGYVVNRGPITGGETQLVQLGVQTTYTDATAVNGTTYYYTVKAKNAVGTGGASNELSATPSPAPPPGITVVGPIGTATLSKAGNSSLSIIVSGPNVVAGHTVIVSVTAGTFGGVVGCTDTKGNPYTVYPDVTSTGRLFICSARIVTALTSGDKITATYPGFSGMTVATASEFAGITGVDQKRGASGNSAAPNSGQVTTTHANELIFGSIAHNSTPTLTPTSDCPMTPIGKVVGGSGGAQKTIDPGYQIVSAIGTFSYCGKLVPSGQWWQAEIVTYY